MPNNDIWACDPDDGHKHWWFETSWSSYVPVCRLCGETRDWHAEAWASERAGKPLGELIEHLKQSL